jgi:molecular chaperone GrpE
MKRKVPMADTVMMEEENAVPGSGAGEAVDSTGSQPAAAVSVEDYERAVQERDQLLDRLARLQAEFDNARKREARERNDYRDIAVAGAVERLLPVLDNFNLALNAKAAPDQMRAGVELIVKQMEDTLRGLGVEPVETVGAVFDPKVHEALDMVETDSVPDHQVLEEVRRGYRIKDRLLRPAMVRVASNPNQKEA